MGRARREDDAPWMISRLRLLVVRADGQTMPEYGIVLALVCVALLFVFGALADAIAAPFEEVRGKI
jgi:Flp pilus assembly pilin Flp